MAVQRNTAQRELVLSIVKSRRDHPSADLIHLDARAADGRISRGTVYRNLSLLSDNGEIMHVKVPGVDRYDWRTDLHYHLLCTGCGAVEDAPLTYRGELDSETENDTGYLITRHRAVFEGLCPKCRKAAEKSAGTSRP